MSRLAVALLAEGLFLVTLERIRLHEQVRKQKQLVGAQTDGSIMDVGNKQKTAHISILHTC